MAWPLVALAIGMTLKTGSDIYGGFQKKKGSRRAQARALEDAATERKIIEKNLALYAKDASDSLETARINAERARDDKTLFGYVAKYNAMVAEANAKAAIEEGMSQAEIVFQRDRETLANQAAIFGASGMSGMSPFLVANNSIKSIRRNLDNLYATSKAAASERLGQASLIRFEAEGQTRRLEQEATETERLGRLRANRIESMADIEKIVGERRATAIEEQAWEYGRQARTSVQESIVTAGGNAAFTAFSAFGGGS